MKWKDVKPIHNQRRSFKPREGIYTIPQFIDDSIKQCFISSVDWECFEQKVSGKTLTSKEACETIYEREGIIPRRFLEQLLRYEGIQHHKKKKKFKKEQIIFSFPDNCELNRIKNLSRNYIKKEKKEEKKEKNKLEEVK